MKPVAKNGLAVLAGFFAGSVVNSLLVNIGPHLIPLPEGADVSSMEGLRASMATFRPANFLFPFLAHALGTLVGAFVAATLAASRPLRLALVIGVAFLLGGIAVISMIGGPLWFNACDLLFAYLPMSLLGGALVRRRVPSA